jgi:hypothetical protein
MPIIHFEKIFKIYLGPNALRCITKDKKNLIFNGIFFCPIF